MTNLFGVPVSEELMNAFLASATGKQQGGEKKAYNLGSLYGKKEPPDVEAKAKKFADMAKKFFDAYVAQGFSHEEAFELTRSNLNTKF